MRSITWLFHDGLALGIARSTALLVVALQIAGSLFEIVGLSALVPLFQFLNAAGDVEKLTQQFKWWAHLSSISRATGIPITVGSLLAFSGALLALRQGFTYIRTRVEYRTREHTHATLKTGLCSDFLLAKAEYQDLASSGTFMSDLVFNAQRSIQHFYSRLGLVTLLAICFVYVVGMLVVSPAMTLLLLAVLVTSVTIVVPRILKARRLGSDLVKADKSTSSFVLERLRLARIVRLSGAEPREIGTIGRLLREQHAASLTAWLNLAQVDALLEVTATAIALCIIYISAVWLKVPIELTGLFLVMLARLLPVARQIAQNKQTTDATRASFERVVALRKQMQDAREQATGTSPMQRIDREIRFDGVSYAYKTRTEKPALDQLDMVIPAHRTTAVVGPSGAGKSTLIDLLPRLRTPDKGTIRFDSVDAREVDLASLRGAIAIVPQTPLIFAGPLKDHIRYGTPDAEMKDVQQAARLANISDFIEGLPQGYDTPAGEGGRLLSGGQRQRLDLARALLSRAPILILDEPTASLDATSAQAFHQALARIRAQTDTTIIIVSHDLEGIRGADHIIVLNEGRVEAAGSHDQVLRSSPWYAKATKQKPDGATALRSPAA